MISPLFAGGVGVTTPVDTQRRKMMSKRWPVGQVWDVDGETGVVGWVGVFGCDGSTVPPVAMQRRRAREKRVPAGHWQSG